MAKGRVPRPAKLLRKTDLRYPRSAFNPAPSAPPPGKGLGPTASAQPEGAGVSFTFVPAGPYERVARDGLGALVAAKRCRGGSGTNRAGLPGTVIPAAVGRGHGRGAGAGTRRQTRSNTAASPCPPPMHIVSSP